MPTPQSISLPEADPLVHVLLILAFLIHALFMNLVVGGTLITVTTDAIGIATARTHYRQLATTLSQWLPSFLGIAVVVGIFPLVMIQILFGHVFTPTASLLGEFWMIAFVAAGFGFGGLYAYKHWRDSLAHRPAVQLGVGVLSAVMFLVVALVFVLASVLLLNPDQWAGFHKKSLGAALSLPSLLPRYGHLMLAAIAGTGIFLVGYGLFLKWKGQGGEGEEPKDRYPTWVIRYGVAWTLTGALPQIVVGPWLLLSLPSMVRGDLISGDSFGSLAFFIGLTTGLLSLVLLNAALMVPHVHGLAVGGTLSLLVTVCLMVVVRHAVRLSWLSQHDQAVVLSKQDQWDLFIIVSLVLVLGLGFMVFMARAFKKRRMVL